MRSPDEYNYNGGGGGLDSILQSESIVVVGVDPLPGDIVCPQYYHNENGVCVPDRGGVKSPCSCPSGQQAYSLDSGDCGCSPVTTITTIDCPVGYSVVNGQCVKGDTVTVMGAPVTVVTNPVSDIETKLKDFYTNNKGLSLAILAGAAYMLFKGR